MLAQSDGKLEVLIAGPDASSSTLLVSQCPLVSGKWADVCVTVGSNEDAAVSVLSLNTGTIAPGGLRLRRNPSIESEQVGRGVCACLLCA